MTLPLLRQLIRYRTVLVALANASITWVILIIAPLGLFAVISCTVAVFLSSLILGFLGDLALHSLMRAGGINPSQSFNSRQSSPHHNYGEQRSIYSDRDLNS